jgi:hypothetical protein
MNLDKTPAKRYYLGKSVALCFAAVVLLIIPSIFSNIDSEGRIISYLLAIFIFLMAIYNFLRYQKSDKRAVVYQNLFTAPVDLKVKYFKQMKVLMYFASPLVSILTALQLNELEAGKTESVALWTPFAFIYENLGYWPVVLSPLCFGMICIAVFRWKINKLKKLKVN